MCVRVWAVLAPWSWLHQLRRSVLENRTRSSKYAQQFLFKRWIAAVRAAIPSYLGVFWTPEFVSAAGGACCAGAREPEDTADLFRRRRRRPGNTLRHAGRTVSAHRSGLA